MILPMILPLQAASHLLLRASRGRGAPVLGPVGAALCRLAVRPDRHTHVAMLCCALRYDPDELVCPHMFVNGQVRNRTDTRCRGATMQLVRVCGNVRAYRATVPR